MVESPISGIRITLECSLEDLTAAARAARPNKIFNELLATKSAHAP